MKKKVVGEKRSQWSLQRGSFKNGYSVSLMHSEVTCHIYLAATGLTDREEDTYFNYHNHLKK